ncbi:hypothetical protein HOLleu_10233 [Holothuria leucospilota]|uniref:Uncharacterized protein n=1 Tax=Holothuria leucospilota TaxID=206669 RepID=A0A9Q1CE14_HOLLE|nr:hypothetical protein HOLleu_10233 [Holothuria leucospilota]
MVWIRKRQMCPISLFRTRIMLIWPNYQFTSQVSRRSTGTVHLHFELHRLCMSVFARYIFHWTYIEIFIKMR